MDWFFLLLLAPVILAPIVLLCGFSGCSALVATANCASDGDCPPGYRCENGDCVPIEQALSVPTRPDSLVATAVSESEIDLTWENTDPTDPDSYQVERHGEGEADFAPIPGVPPPTVETFRDQGLPEGTTFFYQVRACNAGGCSNASDRDAAIATTFPAAPSNLIATALAVDRIDLSWTNNSVRPGIEFRLEHRLSAADNFAEIYRGAATTFSHIPLAEGSDHEYQVVGVLVGFQAGAAVDVSSSPSPAVQARTWAVALQTTLTIDQAGLQGFCLIDRIRSALLSTNLLVPGNGTQVRLTVRGSSAGSLTIDRIYISRVAATGDAYDALAAGVPGGLTRVVDVSLGDPPVVLPAGSSQILNPVAFDFLPTADLLIAFDFNTAAGEGNVRAVALTGSDIFVRANTQQASVADRAPNSNDPTPFQAGNPGGIHYLVEKIEVL